MTPSGIDGDPTQQPVKVISFGYDSDGLKTATNVLSNHISMVHATTTNLTAQEKELVRWHNHLGHMGFHNVQALIRTGVLVTSEAQ